MSQTNQQQNGVLFAGNLDDPPRPPRRPRRHIIRFKGKTVWISEFASIIFVCMLLVGLISVTFVIIEKELVIRDNDNEIASLKSARVGIEHEISELHERYRLISLLRIVVGKRMKEETVLRVADLIHKNSTQYGYNPELLLGVMAVESRFDPEALGRYRSGNLSGAFGIMQIKYPTALEVAQTLEIKDLKESDLFDPEMNIILGTAYLTQMVAQFKNLQLGIIAYNLGPGTVRGMRSRKEALPQQYYEKVLTQYYKLKALGDEIDNEIRAAVSNAPR